MNTHHHTSSALLQHMAGSPSPEELQGPACLDAPVTKMTTGYMSKRWRGCKGTQQHRVWMLVRKLALGRTQQVEQLALACMPPVGRQKGAADARTTRGSKPRHNIL
eukprot:1158572-Pelagomonas_calceolata.AAC.10